MEISEILIIIIIILLIVNDIMWIDNNRLISDIDIECIQGNRNIWIKLSFKISLTSSVVLLLQFMFVLIRSPLKLAFSFNFLPLSSELLTVDTFNQKNHAFRVKTSQSAKNKLNPAKIKIGPKCYIRPFCTKAFN